MINRDSYVIMKWNTKWISERK